MASSRCSWCGWWSTRPTSRAALGIGRSLFFYRLVGVLLFELFQARALLLVFPNVFEYFFIPYETLRSRWDPARRTARSWLVPVIGGLLVVAVRVHARAVRPRLGSPDWPRRLAADPLPEALDEAAERAAWLRRRGAGRPWDTLEKVVLVGLVTVIFVEFLPDLRAARVELFAGVDLLVVINVAWSLALARRSVTRESVWAVGGFRFAFNVGVAVVYEVAIGRGEDFQAAPALFFLALLTLLLVLHDRHRPVAGVRFAVPVSRGGPEGARRSPPAAPVR